MTAGKHSAMGIAENPARLAFLTYFQILICCVSLISISFFAFPDYFTGATFHIFFNLAGLRGAVIVVAICAVIAIAFAFARFSFGYFVGYYLYMMIVSYLWLNCFSDLNYDHRLAGFSAVASAILFLAPSLFLHTPIRQRYVLSAKALTGLLMFILILAALALGIGAAHHLHFVTLEGIYEFREDLNFPSFLNYLIGITSSVLLPYAFACFIARRNYWLAALVLLLLLSFYPVILSKLVFFTPAWLVAMVVLSRYFQARTTIILALLLPTLLGVLIVLPKTAGTPFYFDAGARYLYTVNFRMLAIPAVAMDVYSDFFSKNSLTYFCQISVLKPFISCPYQDQLSIVMERVYKLGNFNASLFATEGIASLGLWFAPLMTFLCGLVISLGNSLSSGLPARFVMISSAVMPQILLNVPLSVALITHGLAVLFLLWYITPRTLFDPEGDVAN